MADDALRSSLFGGAASRNAGKANPYAASAAPPEPSSAGAPGNPFAQPQSRSPPEPHAAAEGGADDAARNALLAGGRKREPSSSISAAFHEQQPAASYSPPQGAALDPLDDGNVEFDFDGLNLMETAGYSSSDLGRRTSSGGLHASGLGGRGGLEGSGLGGAGSSAATTLAALEEELAAEASGSSGGGGGSGGGLGLDLDAFMAQDEVIREALNRGVDLRLYSKQVDAELRAMELLSIRDYVSQADAVAALFEQIEHCEGVLTGMQGMLGSFQDNLGGISREIRSLQEQSLSLSVQMSNRKGLARKVETFLSKVSLPEQLIVRIVDQSQPVDEAWMRGPLAELGEKLSYVSQHSNNRDDGSGIEGGGDPLSSLRDLSVNPFSTPVGRESLPQLEKLRVTACAKLRGHLLRQMQELTRPSTNMAKTQEYVLLKASPGMTFLSDYGGEVGREVRAFYVESVGRHYGEIFRKYWDDLTRPATVASAATGAGAASAGGGSGGGAGVLTCVLAPGALKGDTLTEYNPQARLAAAVASDPSLSQIATALGPRILVDPFELKDRPAILPEADAPPVPSHVAQQEALPPTHGGRARRLPFEAVWRTAVRHLMDVCASEGSFGAQFFGRHGCKEVLALVMAKPLNVLLAGLEEHLIATGDAPGLLLLVALNAALRGVFSEGRYKQGPDNALSGFFDRVTLLLWPRIKTTLDANIAAVKALKDTPVGSRRLLPSPAPAGSDGPGELGPHPLMRRYGELTCSFLLLHRQLSSRRLSDDMLPLHLGQLHREADGLLCQRLAGELSSSRIARLVLLASNYNYLLHLGRARGLGPSGAGHSDGHGAGDGAGSSGTSGGAGVAVSVSSDPLHHWSNECLKATELYCEAQLELHFPQLFAFVVHRVEARMLEYAADNGIALISNNSGSTTTTTGVLAAAAPASYAAAVSNNSTPGAPYTPVPTILQVPQGLPMPSSAIDGSEVQMVVQALNGGWKQGLRSLHEDVLRYFGGVALPAPNTAAAGGASSSIPLSAVLTKRAMQAFLSLHERFTAILNRAFGGAGGSGGSSSSSPLLRELLPAQVILQEMRAKYAPTALTSGAAMASAGGSMGVPM